MFKLIGYILLTLLVVGLVEQIPVVGPVIAFLIGLAFWVCFIIYLIGHFFEFIGRIIRTIPIALPYLGLALILLAILFVGYCL